MDTNPILTTRSSHRWLPFLSSLIWKTDSDDIRLAFMRDIKLLIEDINIPLFPLEAGPVQHSVMTRTKTLWDKIGTQHSLSQFSYNNDPLVDELDRNNEKNWHDAIQDIARLLCDPEFINLEDIHLAVVPGSSRHFPISKTTFAVIKAATHSENDPHEELKNIIHGELVEQPILARFRQGEPEIRYGRPEIDTTVHNTDTIPALAALLNQFRNSEACTRAVLYAFHRWTTSVYEMFSHNLYNPWDACVDAFINEVVIDYNYDLQDPLSHMPIIARQKLADVDIREYMHAVTNMCREWRVSGVEPEELSWRLHKWLREITYRTADSFMVRETIRSTPWLYEIDGNRGIDYFHPLGFPRYQPDDSDSDGEFEIPENLVDVQFRPADPPHTITDYATAIAVKEIEGDDPCLICLEGFDAEDRPESNCEVTLRPMRVKACAHVFHEGCLQELIDGIHAFSNQCPKCRTTICPLRRRERVEVVEA